MEVVHGGKVLLFSVQVHSPSTHFLPATLYATSFAFKTPPPCLSCMHRLFIHILASSRCYLFYAALFLPALQGPSLLYPVKVLPRTSRRSNPVGSRPAISPQPFLASYAPFPYGTCSVPTSWEPVARYPVYLSVPPLYDSDIAAQVRKRLSCRLEGGPHE